MLEGSEECISRVLVCVRVQSNVFETKMVQTETGDIKRSMHTGAFQGNVMRAAWSFMPLLTVHIDLCLVMRQMRRLTSV